MRRIISLLFPVLLVCAVLAVYLPSWNYPLVFDDLRLTEDAIFGVYGGLLTFKQRMLSYGSFIWVHDLFGAGWGKQRLFNIALHVCTTGSLFLLVRSLLVNTKFPEDFESQKHFRASRLAASQVSVALFALSPVAVFAVSYLIQRSIIMATLFSALACWCFVEGLVARRAGWHFFALIAYLFAVLSKEHALITAAMAVPLYIHVRRPPWRMAVAVAGGAAIVLVFAAWAFYGIYGTLIGRLFDPRSVDFAQQLEILHPGVTRKIYPLSIINEASLFFAYGLLWLLPLVQWMSIDLRPAFPLSFASFPQALGAVAYVALLSFGVWALLRRRGALSLVGVALLFPLLFFVTEFSTVWLQDPFVLYRSYLWAIGTTILIAVVLTGFRPRTIYTVGIVVGCIFGMLAFERAGTFQDEYTLWEDAAAKIDTTAPESAVGRWRPFLNLGAEQLEKGMYAQATASLQKAEALGSRNGAARFNIGMAFQQQKKYAEAIAAFDEAQRKGFDDLPLYYQRGESAFALGQYQRAYDDFSTGLTRSGEGVSAAEMQRMKESLQLRRAEAAIGANQYKTAISDFKALFDISPQSARLATGLGMAYTGSGETDAAIALFNRLIASKPSATAFYGRAMAYHTAGEKSLALKDIDKAIALDPRNPGYPQVRNIMAAGKK